MEEMAQQEGGWPLGLQPLNVRIGHIRSLEFSGSLSFSTFITGSSRSTSIASSDFDTESTGSFLQDRNTTLGSLIGISSILELSSRSFRRSKKPETSKSKKSCRSKTWFSLCTKPHISREKTADTPSLGHFLQVERRASSVQPKNPVTPVHELNGVEDGHPIMESNSLASREESIALVGDREKPSEWVEYDGERRSRELNHANGYGLPLLFPCINSQV